MRKLQRFERAVHDECGAEPCAQSKEEHAAAFVTPQGLHRGVVDHTDGMSKGFPDEVGRFAHWLAVNHWPRIADRHDGVAPPGRPLSNLSHHLASGHLRTRRNLEGLPTARGKHLDMGAANIDREDVPMDHQDAS